MNPILDEIMKERERQDVKWGGPDHDDGHHLVDFLGFMNERMERASRGFETRVMIENIALAVAALESFDRKYNAQMGGCEVNEHSPDCLVENKEKI